MNKISQINQEKIETQKILEMISHFLKSDTKCPRDIRQIMRGLEKRRITPVPWVGARGVYIVKHYGTRTLYYNPDLPGAEQFCQMHQVGKWKPQLRVIQGGGNTTPITRKVTRHRKPEA